MLTQLTPDRLIVFEGHEYRIVQVFQFVSKLILREGPMSFVYKQNSELLDKAVEIKEHAEVDTTSF